MAEPRVKIKEWQRNRILTYIQRVPRATTTGISYAVKIPLGLVGLILTKLVETGFVTKVYEGAKKGWTYTIVDTPPIPPPKSRRTVWQRILKPVV